MRRGRRVWRCCCDCLRRVDWGVEWLRLVCFFFSRETSLDRNAEQGPLEVRCFGEGASAADSFRSRGRWTDAGEEGVRAEVGERGRKRTRRRVCGYGRRRRCERWMRMAGVLAGYLRTRSWLGSWASGLWSAKRKSWSHSSGGAWRTEQRGGPASEPARTR